MKWTAKKITVNINRQTQNQLEYLQAELRQAGRDVTVADIIRGSIDRMAHQEGWTWAAMDMTWTAKGDAIIL